MRYFIELSYNGTRFCGWQRQPNAPSVQEAIEAELSKVLRQAITVVGCGRTDTGVHAKQYFLHFDYDLPLPEHFRFRLNKMLSKDIALHRITTVADDAHARFDATHRAYEYHILFQKSPFITETAWYYPLAATLDKDKLQSAADLLLNYTDFFPFCKTNTDVKTMRCDLRRAEWQTSTNGLVFHIAADRFLRGMVRLIVGMCIRVAEGKIGLEEVRQAMDKQIRLDKSYSVPPEGLFLTDIRY